MSIRIEIGYSVNKNKYTITDTRYLESIDKARKYALPKLSNPRDSAYFYRNDLVGWIYWNTKLKQFVYVLYQSRYYPDYPNYLINPNGTLGDKIPKKMWNTWKNE